MPAARPPDRTPVDRTSTRRGWRRRRRRCRRCAASSGRRSRAVGRCRRSLLRCARGPLAAVGSRPSSPGRCGLADRPVRLAIGDHMPAASTTGSAGRRRRRGRRGERCGRHDDVPAGREPTAAVGGAIGQRPAEVEGQDLFAGGVDLVRGEVPVRRWRTGYRGVAPPASSPRRPRSPASRRSRSGESVGASTDGDDGRRAGAVGLAWATPAHAGQRRDDRSARHSEAGQASQSTAWPVRRTGDLRPRSRRGGAAAVAARPASRARSGHGYDGSGTAGAAPAGRTTPSRRRTAATAA